MRTRSAVAVAAGKPLQIMEVNLADPKEGEVLVEIRATGICHTDEFTLSGADPEGLLAAQLKPRNVLSSVSVNIAPFRLSVTAPQASVTIKPGSTTGGTRPIGGAGSAPGGVTTPW